MCSPFGRRLAGVLWPIALMLPISIGAATIAVDSTFDDLDQGPNGNCTLREALVAANGNVAVDACVAGEPGPGVTDVILVPAGIFTLTIAGGDEDQAQSGDLDIMDSVSIEGAGARSTIIDSAGIDRVLDVGNVAAAILGTTLRGGDAGGGDGGGIRNGGTLTVAGCAIEGSVAGGPGGGVRNNNDIFIIDSTLSGNTTGDHGGGMDDHGSSFLENVTVSGNTVTGGGAGGGLYNLGGTNMTVRSATLVGNAAGAGTAMHNGGSTTVSNVLFVGSCDGTVNTSGGGSLESPGDSCGLDSASDQVNVGDAALGPLADNGGGTDTHALLTAGPAIDQGENTLCPDFDQRDEARPFDGDHDGTADCDSGAFEYRLSATIFADGFESGDTTLWSMTVP